jgi:hypothetical protein
MGSNEAARRAGYKPKKTPIAIEKAEASMIELSDMIVGQ